MNAFGRGLTALRSFLGSAGTVRSLSGSALRLRVERSKKVRDALRRAGEGARLGQPSVRRKAQRRAGRKRGKRGKKAFGSDVVIRVPITGGAGRVRSVQLDFDDLGGLGKGAEQFLEGLRTGGVPRFGGRIQSLQQHLRRPEVLNLTGGPQGRVEEIADLLRGGLLGESVVRRKAGDLFEASPVATTLGAAAGASFLGSEVVTPVVGGAVEAFTGGSEFRESLEKLRGLDRRKRDLQRVQVQLEQYKQANLARLAAIAPDIYNQVAVGQRLPRDSMVFGGGARVDLLDQLAQQMATGQMSDLENELLGAM